MASSENTISGYKFNRLKWATATVTTPYPFFRIFQGSAWHRTEGLIHSTFELGFGNSP